MKLESSITIAIDFDSTLAHTRGIFPFVGEPLKGALDAVRMLHSKGYWLIIWTCRDTVEQKQLMIDWLKKHEIFDCFDAINENLPHVVKRCGWDPRKIIADLYIDDRIFPAMDMQKFWLDTAYLI